MDRGVLLQAKHLFRRGVLSEAVLALEAEVTRNPSHTDAWRLLGTAHAENEDDLQVQPTPLAPFPAMRGWPHG